MYNDGDNMQILPISVKYSRLQLLFVEEMCLNVIGQCTCIHVCGPLVYFLPPRGTLYIPECVYLLLKDGVCVSVYIKDILI